MALKELLDAVEFFKALLPATGKVFLARQTNKGFRHHPTTAEDFIAEATHMIEAMASSNAIYFTPNSFKTAHVQDTNGRKRTGRKADNFLSSRCLYADIDCGDGKPYATKLDGIQALGAFIGQAKLPKPAAIVDSGRGVHVYWIFEHDLSPNEWLHAAEILKRLAAHNGFAIDPACTRDSARLLRLPGSENTKGSLPVPVKLLKFNPAHITTLNAFLANVEDVGKVSSVFGNAIADNSALELPEEYRAPSYMAAIVEKCPLMGWVAETHGAECSEPLWKAVLQLAWFTKDGEAWAHTLSDGHPEYDFEETSRKFEERANSMGPSLCQQMADTAHMDGQNFCADCPHHGKIKSPIVLGQKFNAPVVSEDEVVRPHGFRFSDDGVYKIIEGEEQCVLHTRLDKVKVIEAIKEDGEFTVLVEFNFWKDKEYVARFEHKLLADKRALYQELVNQRFSFSTETEIKWFIVIMSAWIDTLRRVGKVDSEYVDTSMGWVRRPRYDDYCFLLGNKLYTPDGDTVEVTTKGLQNVDYLYTPKGTLEAWKAAADLYNNIPELQAVIATAFASPLLHFTNISGAIFAVVSTRSGVGKTSAIQVAQSVWGHPIRGINALDDTEKSLFTKMGVTKNLPAYWDELRGHNMAWRFSKIAFRLSQGKDVSRLHRNAELKETREWKLLLCCASNTPLLDYLDDADSNSVAGIMRLLEANVDNIKLQRKRFIDASNRLTALETNYGVAGEIYAKWLVKNQKMVREAMNRTVKTVFNTLHARHEERFWVTTTAAILLGARIANNLGLTDFKINKMRNFLFKAIESMRAESSTTSASADYYSLMAEFIREYEPSAVVTDHMVANVSRTKSAKILKMPRPGTPITHRIAINEKIIRIPVKVLNSWLATYHRSARTFVQMAKDKGAFISKSKKSLMAHADGPVMRENCYDFFYSKVVPAELVKSKLNVAVNNPPLNNLDSSEEAEGTEVPPVAGKEP